MAPCDLYQVHQVLVLDRHLRVLRHLLLLSIPELLVLVVDGLPLNFGGTLAVFNQVVDLAVHLPKDVTFPDRRLDFANVALIYHVSQGEGTQDVLGLLSRVNRVFLGLSQ